MSNMAKLHMDDFVALQDCHDPYGRGVCGLVSAKLGGEPFSIGLRAPEGEYKYYSEDQWKVVYVHRETPTGDQ